MLKKPEEKALCRIIDANINRAKEGLRVCEEVSRFVLENRALASDFKKMRHAISSLSKKLPGQDSFIQYRDSRLDVGRKIYANELIRASIKDILLANLQRSKESVRVLEEFSKLINRNIALAFKQIRYNIYDIEKRTTRKLLALRSSR